MMIAKVSSIFSTFLDFSIFLGIMLEIAQVSAMLLVHKWATCNLSIPCKPMYFEDWLHLFLAQLSQIWPRADPLTGFGPLFASSWPLSPRYDHQADGSIRACGAKGLKPLPIRHLSSAKFKWYRMISKFIDTKLFPTACEKGVLQWAHERNGNYGNTQKKITLLRVIPTMTSICFVTGKSSGILSGIPSGILFGISSGICSGTLSGISSGISSDILSGIPSDILSGISSGILSGNILALYLA